MVLIAVACLALMVSAVHGEATGRGRAATASPRASEHALAAVSAEPTAAPQLVRMVAPRPSERPSPTPVTDLRRVPVATVGGITLFHPAVVVERVGFHQAADIHDLPMTIARTAVRPMILASRGRPTGRTTAVDVTMPTRSAVYAPVSGIVTRAKGYHLYCKYPDSFVVISPVGHPELEVKILHVTGLRVRPGDRVVAGSKAVAAHPTKFPFLSEIDPFSTHHWPHVHMEVTRLLHPSAKPQPGKGLTMGCA